MKKIIEWLFLRCGYVPERDLRLTQAYARGLNARIDELNREGRELAVELARANARLHPGPRDVPRILMRRTG